MSHILSELIKNNDISMESIEMFIDSVINGEATPEQLAGVLCCLAQKGETTEEILGFIKVMRKHMVILSSGHNGVDMCGTGGDQAGTFNISTTAAFVVAGAGAEVVKHGNRAASSKSGSADVLEALGINIDTTPEQTVQLLETVGMVFLFAPKYHPAMKNIAPVRRALGVPTIFNLLGPFMNPAQISHQLVGVPTPSIARRLAEVARALDYERLILVSGHDGLDEVSISDATTTLVVEGDRVTERIITPEEFGLQRANQSAIAGSDAAQNAIITEGILRGDQGAKHDIVVLNAGFTLFASGVADSPEQGVTLAARSISSGQAAKVLYTLREQSQQFSSTDLSASG